MKKSTLPAKILLIGLGNHGEEYPNTRHNAGREVVMNWLEAAGSKPAHEEGKLRALVSEGKMKKTQVVAALPETFMNNSGKAVELLAKKYKTKPENVWVVHDDMDLPLGTVRVARNRRSAGHRGVESVKRALKTWDFVRFRVGTASGALAGKKGAKFTKDRKKKMIGLLLKPWRKNEEPAFKKAYRNTADAITVALEEGVGAAMNAYNARA